MALYSRSYYSGDGTTTDFTVGFPYLDKAHVKVYLSGDLSTAWSWVGDTTVRLTTAPTSGVTILVKRETSPTARLVDYTAPSSLNEQDLDDDSLQAFYLNQEALDQANSTVGDDPVTGQFTAAGKRITNVADPVNDQDAATKSWVSGLWTSVTATLSGYVASALGYSNAASTSASASASSASAAATSATNAHTSEVNAAASAAAAAASASILTPVESQISGATDAAFTDDDMLTALDGSTGGLLKRSWANVKSAVWSALGGLINGGTNKASPVDADVLAAGNSEATFSTVKLTLINFWTNYLKPKADALYLRLATTGTISVGFTVAPNNLGNITSFTVNPALGNYQYGTNHGAATWTAPTTDCAVDILVTNDATAGSITFSGFTVASGNTGDSLTTTSGQKFLVMVRRINGVSTYIIKALQ